MTSKFFLSTYPSLYHTLWALLHRPQLNDFEYIFISVNVFLDVFLEIIDSWRGLTGVGSRLCDLTEYASCINNGFYKRMFIYCRHFHVNAEGNICTQKISKIDPAFAGYVMSEAYWRLNCIQVFRTPAAVPMLELWCSCCGSPFLCPGPLGALQAGLPAQLLPSRPPVLECPFFLLHHPVSPGRSMARGRCRAALTASRQSSRGQSDYLR